jgi:hypothetical protein
MSDQHNMFVITGVRNNRDELIGTISSSVCAEGPKVSDQQ